MAILTTTALEGGNNIVDDQGVPVALTDDLPDAPAGPTTILMPQICMSFLFLIGGIATYYLDK